MQSRFVVKFGGESGQGINSLGKILNSALKDAGIYTFAYREYPSLIRGGVASYQIDISSKKISSSSRYCNVLAVLDADSFHEYLPSISKDGFVIYDDPNIKTSQEENQYIQSNNINVIYLDSKKTSQENGGNDLMANIVTIGAVWKLISKDTLTIENTIREYFKKKDVDIEVEIKCLNGGYNSTEMSKFNQQGDITSSGKNLKNAYVLTGNDSIALGSIVAGCRSYYGYPMTPATSIFKTLGSLANETGMLVKQAENEITAALMALGSMYMGSRSLVSTSGGGFDLMLETISCSGISETPLVIVLAQRNGPGTGVPTWSGAGDLLNAVNGGHGEYPKCVISVSDPESAYILTQKAFDIADKYQLPVIILTEKQIAESLYLVESLPADIPVERYLSDGELRYQNTDTGISPRWLPQEGKKPYLCTSDEHIEDGSSTEDENEVKEMMDKRFRKLQTLRNELPEPTYFGSQNPKVLFIGQGSIKSVVVDALESLGEGYGYLHYEFISPLKTERLVQLSNSCERVIILENNQSAQLSKLIKSESGLDIKERILKYDGRPFFIEDILDYLKQ